MLQPDSSTNAGVDKLGTGTWQLSGQNNFGGQVIVGAASGVRHHRQRGRRAQQLGAPVSSGSGTISLTSNAFLRFVGGTSQTSNRIMGIPNASGTYYLDARATNNPVLAINGGVSNANRVELKD